MTRCIQCNKTIQQKRDSKKTLAIKIGASINPSSVAEDPAPFLQDAFLCVDCFKKLWL